jgi:aspartate--ammonia ligase
MISTTQEDDDGRQENGSGRAGQEHFLQLPYHQAILNDEIPLSIGGGIGQSRTFMYLLRTAHLGEVSVTVWPEVLKSICKRKNIRILE